MKYTRKPAEEPVERQLVTGMVVSTPFLQQVAELYDPRLLESTACRAVAGWCLDYLREYRQAPGAHVQDIYDSHVRAGTLPEADAAVVAAVLARASEEHERAEQFNVEYLLDVAERYLKGRSLRALADDLKAALTSPALGVEEAERVLEEFRRVERPRAQGVDPLTDRVALTQAFAEPEAGLFRFGGALGEMMNPLLTRAGFLALLAPPKRGKSWFLMEFALKAVANRCNVAFFECGDMTQAQWLRRFHTRLAAKPYRHYRPDYLGDLAVPYLLQEDGETVVDHRFHKVELLDARVAARNAKRFLEGRNGRGKLKLVNHAARTLTVSQIRTQLDLWARVEGFVPDVVVLDYADILAADRNGAKEFRQQQNDIWTGLRGVSQERHALVVTASQSDAEGMERPKLSMRNFSEDMRKLAHVTGMYGLNQTLAEKRQGLLRVNEIVVREGEWDGGRSVTVLQALRVGRPVLDSFWTPSEEKSDANEK